MTMDWNDGRWIGTMDDGRTAMRGGPTMYGDETQIECVSVRQESLQSHGRSRTVSPSTGSGGDLFWRSRSLGTERRCPAIRPSRTASQHAIDNGCKLYPLALVSLVTQPNGRNFSPGDNGILLVIWDNNGKTES